MKKTVFKFLAMAIGLTGTFAKAQNHRPKAFEAVVRVNFGKEYAGDTIHAELNLFIPARGQLSPQKKYIAILGPDGKATILMNLGQRFAYISLARDIELESGDLYPFISNYLVESEDNITVNVQYEQFHPNKLLPQDRGKSKRKLQFSGKGSEKFQCYETWNSPMVMLPRGTRIPMVDSIGRVNSNNSDLNDVKYKLGKCLSLLGRNQNAMVLAICKTDMLGEAFENFGGSYYSLIKSTQYLKNRQRSNTFILNRPSLRDLMQELTRGVPNKALQFSKSFSKGAYAFELLDYLRTHTTEKTLEFYKLLKDHYTGNIRDQMLYRWMPIAVNEPDIVNDCISSMSSPLYKQAANNLLATAKGALAYNFSLPDVNGKSIKLSDFKGKVVFMDFYFNACHGCSAFYQDNLKYVEEHFRNNKNVVFVPVSIDANKPLWLQSIASGRLTSDGEPNVINVYTAGQGEKHPLIKHYNIQFYPTPILIGKDGHIIEFMTKQDKGYLVNLINNAL